MKVKYIFKSLLVVILLSTAVTGCDYDKELIEELPVNREFAPIELSAMVRNQVNVELNWRADDNVENYVVEFSDDADFNNIVKTVEVTAAELPVLIPVESETLYYIRVKGVSARGLDDSTWATTTAQTLTEQIFIEGDPSDIRATEATLRWAPDSQVTEIKLTPGNITYTITAEDRVNGYVTLEDLTPETAYTATLYNGTRIRGVKTFTTGIDIGAGILVTPEDDLLQMIADAEAGAILVLQPGDYTEQTGTINLNKSITIRGLRSFDKPKLKVNFKLAAGAEDVAFIDLDVEGATGLDNFLEIDETGDYNSVLISGSTIHDFSNSLIKADKDNTILENLTIENSIIYNILTSGGDFIDFRKSAVMNLNINTSTFYNVAPARDFLRLDEATTSGSGTGNTINVMIDRVTIYASSNVNNRRILYVRYQNNDITVKNTIIAQTAGIYSNQTKTDQTPVFSKNNYFNAPGFYDTTVTVHDASGTYYNLDPGFTNPAEGDFTITNQTLIDNNVGDPRWRP